MTIADNYTPIRQIGDGVTTQFSASWSMIAAAYATVFLEDATTGVQTAVTQGAGANQYTISITSSGFTVTFNTAPTSQYYVIVGRTVTKDQNTPYKTSKGFQGPVEEASFDKLTALVQQLSNQAGRNISAPLGDTANLQLPKASLRANSYLTFDASGNVTISSGLASVAVSTAMSPVVQAATKLAGFNLLAASGGAFGASPTMPTPSVGDNSIKGATTAFVQSSIVGKNRIINGDMRIDQRNSGSSLTVTTDGSFSADRWRMGITQASKFSVQRISNSTLSTNNYAIKLTSLSSFSPAASDQMGFGQTIEGLNISDFLAGTSNGKPFTVSFKAKASIAGNYTLRATYVGSTNYFYATTFNIAQANVEQAVSVTFPACTTGTFNSNTSAGIVLWVDLGSGSTYTAAASGSWGTTQIDKVTGSVSLLGTNGATFEITDAQLEIGSVATPFERSQIGQELALCQRYTVSFTNLLIALVGSYGNTNVPLPVNFPVEMRSTPTMVSGSFSASTGANGTCSLGSLNSRNNANPYNSGTAWTANATILFTGLFSSEL